MGSKTEVQIGEVWDATSVVRPPKLVRNVVHLWRRRLQASSMEVSASYQLLSAEEQERAGRFRIERARNDFVLTRGTLRTLLARYLEHAPQELRFRYANRGKPVLEEEYNLCFNVSHTDGLALIAVVKQRAIGVDVENISRKTPAKELAERFFSEQERAALRHLGEDELQAAFFRCWTRKEAYIKAKGDGLSIPLHQFDVSMAAGERDVLIATRPDTAEEARWLICDVPIGAGYAAAVAVALE
ncbi:MAG TPA: 4'-phosphopantetheinyl transferase superfamily protein [Candidatus Sulfotelmatobacter sp.]|nr:4'-phosphopantetheinyl transferase superfamily protein [Candidatus Sulfotelmatobacter sp.]